MMLSNGANPLLLALLLSASLPLLLVLLNAGPSTASSDDYYSLLGVASTANAAQIKRAFKKLVLEKHPDRNKADPNANTLFMRINRAYEVLKSPELRERYDRFGEAGLKAHEEEGQQFERAHGDKSSGMFADDLQIVKLTPERYEEISRSSGDGQIWFINFYASHVSRSEKYAQLWREVGHELEDVIRVGAIDCQEAGYLCENIPELRNVEPPVLFFYPGHYMYTGPLSKESLLDAALRRISASHVELTEANIVKRLSDAASPAHWLLTFCGRGVDCFSQRTLKKLAFVFNGYVGVARVDCGEEPNLCRRLNPAASSVDSPSSRLFVNASAGADNLEALGHAGLAVTSLHTQETVRGVLRLLPPLPAVETETANRLSQAVFESGSLRQAHLLLLEDDIASSTSNADAQLKRLKPLLQPHKVRVVRLVCGSSEDSSIRSLCQRLPIIKSRNKQQTHQPNAVLIKRTGDFEIYYGQVHYMDIKEFALAAIANPMTSLTTDTFATLIDNAPKGTYWFVDFFAPWCPPCMKALPQMREAARLYETELGAGLPAGARVRFGAVDCTIDKGLCNRLSINSYPSLLLFLSSSKRVKFRGSKFAHQMLAFVEAFVKPTAVYFNPDSLKSTVLGNKRQHVWLVYYHSVNCQPCVEFMPELNALAKNFEGHSQIRIGAVDCVTHRSLCNEQGIRSYPTIRAYPADKTGPSDYFDYNSPFRNSESIASWLESFAPQSVLRFSRANFQSEIASDEPWVVYFYADWCGPCQAFAPTFKSLASSLSLQANFGKLDCDAYQDLCVSNGIQTMPSVALFKNGKVLKHLTGQSVYNLDSAVNMHFTGKLKKARVFYAYHDNQFNNNDDDGDDGDGWRRIVINGGGGGGSFGAQFQFGHDEF